MEAIFAVGAISVAERVLVERSALLSFAFRGKFWTDLSRDRLIAGCSRVVLDSGAFSAWTKGTPIVLEEYMAYMRASADRFAWFAALDDIESSTRSVENWHTMRRVLPELAPRIVPVFHEGEPIEVLDEYVAAGGLVGLGRTEGRRSKPKTFEFYDVCFNLHPSASFHALGNGSPETLEVYPFASFDCTTWERDAAYGGKHGWPWSSAAKETRMRAYVEALSTIQFRGGRTPDMFALAAVRAATERLTMEG